MAESEHDRQLLSHVSRCETCAARLTSLTSDVDTLRAQAWREADAAFDDAALEVQRSKILERLAHLGKAARVLRFPGRVRDAAMPVSAVSRRWVSVAAAAGLLIGLLTGQLIHFVPWDVRGQGSATPQAESVATPLGSAGPIIVQAGSAVISISDDELLDQIDEAMQLRRAASLRALDAFTPRVGDLVESR